MTDVKQMTAVIGTFADRHAAERYVAELKRAGFKDSEIGMTSPHREGDNTLKAEEDIAVGAVAGGALGAVAGAVATGLIPGVGPVLAVGLLAGLVGGAAAGATAGGLIGALVGLGIPEEEARRYEQEFLAGRTLVVVQSPGRAAEALAILRRGEPAV
jgi:hypothetical protein